MADSVIIGRVAVKVYPHTAGFKADLKEDLERIEKGLKGIRVGLELDDQGLAEKVKAAAKAAKEAAETIKIPIDFDGQDEIRKVLRELDAAIEADRQKRRKFSEVAKDDLKKLRFEAARLRKELRFELAVDPKSQDSVRQALAKVDAELARRRKKIQFSAEMNVKDLEKMRRQINSLRRMELEILPGDEGSLKAAFDKIDEEIKRRDLKKIEVALDFPSLVKKRTELKAELDKIAKVRIDLETKTAEESIRKLEALMLGFKKQARYFPIGADLNPADERKARREIEGMLKRFNDLRLKLVDEKDPFNRRKIEHEMEEIQERLDKLKAKPEVKPEIADPQFRHAQARLAMLARSRVVQLIPVVSKKAAASAGATLAALSGARAMHRVFDNLWNWIKDLDKAVPKIATLGSAFMTLAAATLAATSNILSLGYSLAAIAPAALVLPGLLVGMALGFGATFAALKDMNTVLPEVKQGFTDLQDTISTKFWEKAKEPFRDFYNNVFPSFRDGMAETGTEAGNFFAKLSDSFKSVFTPEVMGGLFKGLNDSIRDFTNHTDSIANITRILGNLGSNIMPRLARWTGQVTDQFSNWLTVKEASGELQRMVDKGIENFKALGRVLRHTGGIFAGLGRAAEKAGGSTLSSLAANLERIHGVVDSPGFQKGMTQVFKSAHQFMDDISYRSSENIKRFFKSLPDLFEAVLGDLGPALGRTLASIFGALNSPSLHLGIRRFAHGLTEFMDGVRPAFKPIADGLGVIFTVVGKLAGKLGGPLGKALTAVSNAVQKMEPFLLALVDLLGDVLADAIDWIAPKIEKIGEKIGGWAQNVRDLNDRWKELNPEQKASKLKALVAGVAALGAVFLAIKAAGAITGVISALGGLSAIGSAASAAIAAIASPVGLVVLAIAAIIGVLVAAYLTVEEFRTRVNGGLTEVQQAFQGLLDTVAPIMTEITSTISGNGLQIEGTWRSVWEAIGSAMEFYLTYISAQIQLVTTFIKWVWTNWGEDILGWLDSFTSSMSMLFTGLSDIISGIFKTLTALLKGDWEGVWSGILQTLQGAIGLVTALMIRFKNAVLAPLRVLAGLAQSVGGDFAAGFIRGIVDWIDSVADAAARMAQRAIEAVKGAIRSASPSKETMQLGDYFGEGFALGIERRVKTVADSARTLGEAAVTALSRVSAPSLELSAGVSHSVAPASAYKDGAATPVAPIHVEANMQGSNLTPEEVADSILFAVRRSRLGGAYA